MILSIVYTLMASASVLHISNDCINFLYFKNHLEVFCDVGIKHVDNIRI